MAISKEDILAILRDEKTRSLGFDGDDTSSELRESRESALKYYKGDVSDDIPSLDNRSTATSSDVADAVEHVLPQLTEIFLEEEALTFVPNSETDILAAEQETDFTNYVIFKQNDGFGLLNTAGKDALLLGQGVFFWQWDECPDKEETFTDLCEFDMQNLMQTVPEEDIVSVEETKKIEVRVDEITGQQMEPQEESTYTVVVRKKQEGRVRISAWAPDDVAVSEDTRKLGDGTYTGFRSRIRRQELIADGFDEDDVAQLPRFGSALGEAVNTARDQAGEQYGLSSGNSLAGLDTVQVIHNFIRVLDGDEMKLHYVVTGGDETVVLKMEEVDRVPASSICPFPNPHRFYGQSMADKLMEVQRINTALMRMALDSGYFAMNQRVEVAETGVTKHTLSDVLNNTPGAPIRVKATGTVTPVTGGSMNFPVLDMMEFMKGTAEQRSGVSRQSMGLSVDTMHDTKGGMLALMDASQIRTRYIARIWGETGIKDMFLGVHDMLRKNSTMEQTARLRGKFVPINPSSWAAREHMSVEIGNAGGREFDLQALSKIGDAQQKIVEFQGGANGPLVTVKHIANTATRMASRMGFRAPEQFFTDPAQAEQMSAQQQGGQQGPDPAMVELQGKMQLEQVKMQNEMQMKQAQGQADLQAKGQEMQQRMQLQRMQMEQELQLERERMNLQHQADLEKIRLEAENKRKQIQGELQMNLAVKKTEVEMEQYKMEVLHDPNAPHGPRGPFPGGDAAK